MTVFYIVIAVLVLLFGIFSYLNMATWNVLHVLGAFLTFGAAFAYVVLASAVLRTETSWKRTAEQLTQTLEDQRNKVEMLERGLAINDRTGAVQTVDDPTQSVRGAEAELQRVLYDRGRVWRDVQRGAVNNQQIMLQLPPVQVPRAGAADAPADPAAAANPATPAGTRSLAVGDVIYAFGQMPHPEDPTIFVPAYFIGEFVVRTVQGPSVAVEPTTKLDRAQQQVLNLQNPWMVYDKLPVDQHEIFQEMEDAELATLIRGACARLGLPQPMADEVLASITKTGKAAAPDDPELAVQSRVVFQQDHEVDVDAAADAAGIVEEYEPASGLAAATYLKQGGPTQFKKGDQLILPTDRDPGKSLVDQGIVTVEEQVYVRPLIDFAYDFLAYKAQVERIQDNAYTLKEDIAMLTKAETIAKDVVAYREQEKTKLEEDKAKVVYEQEQIAQYKQKLLAYLTETLKENSQLYRTNQTLVDELKRVHEAVLRRVNQEGLSEADPDALTMVN